MRKTWSYDFYYAAAEIIIEGAGEYQDDPNFVDTPDRFARAMSEFFWSKKKIKKQLKKVVAVEFPTSDGKKYDGMIFKKNIRLYTFCPHHILPVALDIHIGYIPGKKGLVAGASKLTRIADILSRRMVLQETLALDIANFIEEKMKAEGVAVVLSGVHDCMRIRGIKQQNATYDTPIMRGSFKKNKATRDEFFHLIMKG